MMENILDIGDETVKIYVTSGSYARYLDRFGVLDSRDFEKDILEKAITELLQSVREHIDIKRASFLVYLPPSFAKARIAVASYKRGDPEKNISAKESDEIRMAVLKEAGRDVSDGFAKAYGILPQDVEFLSQEIIGTKIDGYETSVLEGYGGENLEFRVLSIFIPKHYLKNFQEIINDSGIKNFKISHPAANISKSFVAENAVLLDMGGECTQIFLIRNGKLVSIDDFAMGGRNFSRAVSQIFGLSEEESRNLKERYANGELSEISRQKMKEIFLDAAKDWMAHLKARLKTIKGLLPSLLFLSGGGSKIPEISEVLSEDDWEVKKYDEKNFRYHTTS